MAQTMRRPRPLLGEDEALRLASIATERPRITSGDLPTQRDDDALLDALLAAQPDGARWMGHVGLIVAAGFTRSRFALHAMDAQHQAQDLGLIGGVHAGK